MGSLMGNTLEKNSSSQIKSEQFHISSTKSSGGWVTLPFIIGSIMGLSMAAGTWCGNLTMFLVNEYHMTDIVASRIYNVINVGVNLIPIFGGVLADCFLGSFLVINVASFASLLGLIMLGLSTTIPTLRPACTVNHPLFDKVCETPSANQYMFLLVALLLAMVGFGCSRFMLLSFGLNQFDKKDHRRIFLNVYVLGYQLCWAVSYATTVVVVQTKLSWSVSFGIGITGNTIAIILFLCGSQYYRRAMPLANVPLVKTACVLMSAVATKVGISKPRNRIHDLEMVPEKPISDNNRSSTQPEVLGKGGQGVIHNENMLNTKESWSLSLFGPLQVEDLIRVAKMIPLYTTGILLNTTIAMVSYLIVIQASAMDLTIWPRTKLPAQSISVILSLATVLTLAIYDRFIHPLWQKIVGKPMKPLQRSGNGHVYVLLGIISLALVEMSRLKSIKGNQSRPGNPQDIAPAMSAWCLMLPVALLGVGLGFYIPGGLFLYYHEFPKSLKSTSSGVPSTQVALGFYLSKIGFQVIEQHTSWLPKDNNFGRLDLVYWILASVVAINYGYFLICSTVYKYQYNSQTDESINNHNHHR